MLAVNVLKGKHKWMSVWSNVEKADQILKKRGHDVNHGLFTIMAN